MLDNYVKKFLSSGSEQDAIDIVRFCRTNKIFNIGERLGKFLTKLFPHRHVLFNETALCAYYNKNYTLAYDLFSKILEFKGLPFDVAKSTTFNNHFCIPHVADRYNYYNPKLVKSLTKKKNRPFPMVTFTMTSCKRYNLFKQTVNSFLNACTDLHKIDYWLCIDDNSSEKDRAKMKAKYPFFKFIFKTPQQKGHPQSMNMIKNMVTTPYIFHVEDDWKFFSKRAYISDCFDVLHSNPVIGQCLINKNYGETNECVNIIGGIPRTTSTGLRYLIHDHCPDMNEFVKKYGMGNNCGYWEHFSLRPSLLRRSVLQKLGDFNEQVSHFEKNYCSRYVSAGYVSAFLEGIYCLHIGRLTSECNDKTKLNAYDLNGEAQFTGKEEKILEKKISTLPTQKTIRFKMVVINLDKRPDRWEKFIKNDVGLNYERFSAIDGSVLETTPQLLRIFDGNDYNMRVGMVGCAMSHVKLYTDLINSDFDFFVIFEDDVELVPNFKNKLVHVLNTTPVEWDLIYLGHHLLPDKRAPENYDKENLPIVEKWSRQKSLANSMGGTGGYVISKEGAKKLLDFIDRTGMTNCIDTMQQKSADNLNVYYCKPHLFYSECFIGQNKADLDTDIQFNYDSLTVDINTRFVQELLFYKNSNVQIIVDFEQMENLVQNNITNNVLIFRDDENPTNIAKLLSVCKYPCYTVGNQILVVVFNPTDEHKTCRYFHRFKKNGVYDVSDALQ